VRYIAKLILVSALMIQIGAPWMLVQGIAWVSMAVTYSLDEGSVDRGLVKTFDGEHPCCLCKAAAKGRQSEQKPAAPSKELKKLKCETLLGSILRIPSPHSVRLPVLWESRNAQPRSEAPASPPPELA
jgi:hypothetical protein